MTECYCENCGSEMVLDYKKGCYVCEICGNTTLTESDNKYRDYIG